MAIVEVIPKGGNSGKFGKYREHTTKYQIVTDSVMTTFEVGLALYGYGLWYGNYAAFDPWALARNISLSQDDLGLIYDLTIDWSNEPENNNMKDEDGKPVHSPFDAFPIWSWSSQEVFVPRYKDLDDKPYVYVNNVPIPSQGRTLNRNILTITTNEEDFDDSENDYYSGSCNGEIFFDYSPKRCFFISSTATSETYQDPETMQDLPYAKVTRQFGFLNGEEADLLPYEILNMQSHKIDGTELTTMKMDKGKPTQFAVTEPVPVKANGIDVVTNIGDLHYIQFRNLYQENYADLFADWGIG